MKKTMAKVMQAKRRMMPIKEKGAADAAIFSLLSPYLEKGKHVAAFASMPEEINLDGLFQTAVQLYFPKIIKKGQMEFYPVSSDEDFSKGAYGILEPQSVEKVAKDKIDIFIVPLLAFNAQGYRIGYGGGYYDRYLKDAPGLKIGIGYSFQQLEESFQNDYDVPCDLIITERGIV